jgi:hypothetical protein
MARRNGNIDIADGISSTNFGAFGVKGDGERTPRLEFFCCASILNDAFVVLIMSIVGN